MFFTRVLLLPRKTSPLYKIGKFRHLLAYIGRFVFPIREPGRLYQNRESHGEIGRLERSVVSFDLQCCTGKESRLSVNCNGVYSSVFFFKISQLPNVHNYKLQDFLLLPVYFRFFNFKMISSGLIIKCLDMFN